MSKRQSHIHMFMKTVCIYVHIDTVLHALARTLNKMNTISSRIRYTRHAKISYFFHCWTNRFSPAFSTCFRLFLLATVRYWQTCYCALYYGHGAPMHFTLHLSFTRSLIAVCTIQSPHIIQYLLFIFLIVFLFGLFFVPIGQWNAYTFFICRLDCLSADDFYSKQM